MCRPSLNTDIYLHPGFHRHKCRDLNPLFTDPTETVLLCRMPCSKEPCVLIDLFLLLFPPRAFTSSISASPGWLHIDPDIKEVEGGVVNYVLVWFFADDNVRFIPDAVGFISAVVVMGVMIKLHKGSKTGGLHTISPHREKSSPSCERSKLVLDDRTTTTISVWTLVLLPYLKKTLHSLKEIWIILPLRYMSLLHHLRSPVVSVVTKNVV